MKVVEEELLDNERIRMCEWVHVRAVWGCLIYILITPTDDMNNIIKGS